MVSLSRARGFTLIELVVTVTLVAIIVGIAVPSFRDLIISNSVSFSRDQFFQALTYSRSEAIKLGTSVSVCKSDSGSSCDDSLSWQSGWLIFSDADRDGVLESGDRILQYQTALEGNVTMAHGGGDDIVTFDSRGLSLRGDGTFTFAHSAGSAYNRSIDLSVTGRATKGT